LTTRCDRHLAVRSPDGRSAWGARPPPAGIFCVPGGTQKIRLPPGSA
jgi:hypothetical protein